jgi:hypothetical protein
MRFFSVLIFALAACRFSSERSQNASQILTLSESCVLSVKQDRLWRSEREHEIPYKCQAPVGQRIEEVQCREAALRGQWKPCPAEGSYRFESLRSGTYFFEVRAKLSDGRYIDSPLYFWKVDLFAPTLLDVDYSFEKDSEIFRYRAEATDSGGSGLSAWQCRFVPGKEWKSCEGDGLVDFAQALGAEQWEIRALDRAGNASPAFEIRKPESFRNLASTESICQWDRIAQYWLPRESLTLSFTCLTSRNSFEAIEYFAQREGDSVGEWKRTPSIRHLRFEKLAQGEHSLKLRIRYSGSEESPAFPFRFGIDSLAPKAFVSEVHSSGQSFAARLEASDEGSGVEVQECRLEHSSGNILHDWQACPGRYYFGRNSLKWRGNYLLKFRARDFAGNLSVLHTREIASSETSKDFCFAYEQQSEDAKYWRVNFHCALREVPTAYECRNHSLAKWESCLNEDHHLIRKNGSNLSSFEVRARTPSGWTEPVLALPLRSQDK